MPSLLSAGTGPRENTGTLAGAVAGATVGSQFGGLIGAALDDKDRERAYAAQIDALDRGSPGAPVGWRNQDSGRRGTVVPGPAYDTRGMQCRAYTHTIHIDGRPQIARGAACRGPDGTWNPVG